MVARGSSRGWPNVSDWASTTGARRCTSELVVVRQVDVAPRPTRPGHAERQDVGDKGRHVESEDEVFGRRRLVDAIEESGGSDHPGDAVSDQPDGAECFSGKEPGEQRTATGQSVRVRPADRPAPLSTTPARVSVTTLLRLLPARSRIRGPT